MWVQHSLLITVNGFTVQQSTDFFSISVLSYSDNRVMFHILTTDDEAFPLPVGVIRASRVCCTVLEYPCSHKKIQSLQQYTVPFHTVFTFRNINQVSTSVWINRVLLLICHQAVRRVD